MWGINKKIEKTCGDCEWFASNRCAYIGTLSIDGNKDDFKDEPTCELFQAIEPGVGSAIIGDIENYVSINHVFDDVEPTEELKELLDIENEKLLERTFGIDESKYLEQENTIVIKLNNEIFTSVKYENDNFIIESWYGRLVIPAYKANILGEKLTTIIRAINAIKNILEFNG
jgi:hypothetical protein